MTPQQFYARALAAAADGRLPVPEQSMWDIFPFDPERLRVKPLTFPEPPRGGEGGLDCWRADPDGRAAWSNERWTLEPVREPRVPFAALADLGEVRV